MTAGRDALRDAAMRWLYRNTGRREEDLPALTDDLLAELPIERFAAEQVAAALNSAADHIEARHTALNALGAGTARLDDLLYVEDTLRARAAAVLAAPDNDRSAD